ncbi:MAG: holo-ACP synthase [Clostridia bacterium]
MKIQCGVDIIENRRIKEAVEKTERFLEKNYTDNEIEYCRSKKAGMYQSLAARFAAKEAVAKALGTGFTRSVQPKNIEILTEENGRPYVVLNYEIKKEFRTVSDISLSMSHCTDHSVAYAVITFTEDDIGN